HLVTLSSGEGLRARLRQDEADRRYEHIGLQPLQTNIRGKILTGKRFVIGIVLRALGGDDGPVRWTQPLHDGLIPAQHRPRPDGALLDTVPVVDDEDMLLALAI